MRDINPPPADRHAVAAERVFDGRRWWHDAAVVVERGRIGGIDRSGTLPQDCPVERLPGGAVLAPGFIDLQVNGAAGLLLNDEPSPARLRAIARAHRRFGTTACLPTLMSDRPERMRAAIAAARAVAGDESVLGLHLEGPFLSPLRPGIHPRRHIRPPGADDIALLCELATAGRSLVTLAPECVPEGVIRRLVACGLRVSAGHSAADAATVLRAIDEGLTGVTHLFNAMPPLQARAPGLVGAALADARLTAGLIIDGHHVDPLAVRAAFAAKGAARLALVSDAMPTVGTDQDRFSLFGRTIALRDGRLTADDGTLAGAHLDLGRAVRNAVHLAGIALEHALRAATLTPAEFLGCAHERGSLHPGARADLVALDAALEVAGVWIAGERLPAV